MTAVRCVDGRELALVPVPVLDRQGVPYEATLRLTLDGAPWAEVGQRCAGLLAALRARLSALPPGALLDRGLPPDVVLLALRTRDPDDAPSRGELLVRADAVRTWTDAGWQARTDVVVQAWGDDGTGVRGVLTVAGLCALLDALLVELRAAGAHAGP